MVFQLAILQVSDLEKSLAFYQDLLGVPLLRQSANPAGAQMAFLGQEDAPNIELVCKGPLPQGNAGACQALGFLVEDALGIARRAGEKPEGPFPMGPHKQFYYIRDPDGYRVQLAEEKQ